MLKRTNIEEKLKSYRDKSLSEKAILDQVQAILTEDTNHENRILESLESGNNSNQNNFDFDLLESSRIYHIDQIEKICIDYRLRFLNSKYFKGQIPREAISEIKNLEKSHDTVLSGLKIMAPSKLFKLENADDPLLFAPIGNDYYYLIHKWGNDLHPLRKLMVLPFKNLFNLIVLVLLLSYVATLIIPMELFTRDNSSSNFWLLYFFMFKMIGSITIFYGFALGKNFNKAIWKSKYFNA
ncbi:hypothetical protein HX109_12465 [Galbibacter sp. BG1]|uniref:hypothetical protein n=1 Tax=Galbibacter sp. BG1 TaxID=1170699 RepID=UPI0015C12FA9|nr:hypothetical protein [Galbibacter sp. BG1]QLE02330.1 hypothetical protein HX109_12465 [Galbibacter sp. BG1]